MTLDRNDEIQLSCEKCGTVLSANGASRTILSDGQIHVFCEHCMRHVLIVKDGLLKF